MENEGPKSKPKSLSLTPEWQQAAKILADRHIPHVANNLSAYIRSLIARDIRDAMRNDSVLRDSLPETSYHANSSPDELVKSFLTAVAEKHSAEPAKRRRKP